MTARAREQGEGKGEGALVARVSLEVDPSGLAAELCLWGLKAVGHPTPIVAPPVHSPIWASGAAVIMATLLLGS